MRSHLIGSKETLLLPIQDLRGKAATVVPQPLGRLTTPDRVWGISLLKSNPPFSVKPFLKRVVPQPLGRLTTPDRVWGISLLKSNPPFSVKPFLKRVVPQPLGRLITPIPGFSIKPFLKRFAVKLFRKRFVDGISFHHKPCKAFVCV